ncbi:MAG: hypothetical protein E5X53_33310 [Mesorhizobium sp.]|uniref:hypothetical protein n=1 Tax=Mesorhizobium sp. TaxID=1871066 RepID=UPI000FE95158|nr:hypothetical protein [Mesorhizobium sp.]RWM12718.1 MAG: hypothetical protein EOR73_31140 [Mesorhizobium sp.]TIP72483.1 MAG: hypothetical protein E5X55_17455 [Mesorhizobium sp.]TIQ04269.1 MAG: hypothetical protein E5X57_29880 [Mesorhizobium sp.]TIR47603.1 MAG: hypothetical protein E5X53_33310 [Mesorhizobium sp.]TJV94057.1 MAG: hypothetical protein E5X52_30600 [Mesorhizobium sp.]
MSYAIQHTPDMVQQHYAQFLPQDKATIAAQVIRNFAEWRLHVLEHLHNQVEATGNLLGHRRPSRRTR